MYCRQHIGCCFERCLGTPPSGKLLEPAYAAERFLKYKGNYAPGVRPVRHKEGLDFLFAHDQCQTLSPAAANISVYGQTYLAVQQCLGGRLLLRRPVPYM